MLARRKRMRQIQGLRMKKKSSVFRKSLTGSASLRKSLDMYYSTLVSLNFSYADSVTMTNFVFYLVYVNTFLADELKDLYPQGSLIEMQISATKRNERDHSKTEKKLSMYASVTEVIPNIDDLLKTSGYMVDRDKRVIEKFELDAGKMATYETCNSIWQLINKQ